MTRRAGFFAKNFAGAGAAFDAPTEALMALFAGMVATIPVTIFGPVLLAIDAPGFTGVLVRAFLHAAVPEELAKFAALIFCLRRSSARHLPLHAMALGAIVGLGFGSVETAVYALNAGLGAAAMRLFTAIPCHLFLGVLVGHYLWAAVVRSVAVNVVKAVALPTILHGLYDLPLMAATALATPTANGYKMAGGVFEHALVLSALVLFLLAAWSRYFLRRYSRGTAPPPSSP